MTTTNVQDDYRGSSRAGTIAMAVLGVMFVILRFLARWKKSLKPGLDDFTILGALVPFLALVGLMLALNDFGMGSHSEKLAMENIIMIAKLLVTFECMFVTTIAVTRVSILLMYCRIFPTREMRITSMILGGISILWCVAVILVDIFQCTPIVRAWDKRIPGHCINLEASFIANAVPNIGIEILILSLPVRVVWGLHASLTHRLVVFTSIYRITTLFEYDPADVAWTLGKSCTWCIIESSTGIISACMPTLRPLFLMFSSKFSSQSGTHRTRTEAEHSKGFELHNSALRPSDEPRNKTRVQLGVSHPDDGSDDEVPLNAIRVQQDMIWQESRGDSSLGYS
ncbi:hypothetical protein PDIG_49820 [Penicillium digitatum PHI26]|uniref:Rhodopsin domain-containing protein n=2 Tax=Penicillium digitatum TaxID=36651 RepID=K9FQT4_PEND2|nr:hypothetical protein PDIP_42680 [Penicillium digitatum Pd1]EKV11539.1 hypothetical protein PDIG_49820 [Penicillium digitatum PHI26]EKV14759.1 hypothetical protein PDIP_42680 [Penicillium digitatum Pd1]